MNKTWRKIAVFGAIGVIAALAMGQSVLKFNQFVTGLPSATTPLIGNEPTVIVQGGISKQVPVNKLPGSGSSSSGTSSVASGGTGATSFTANQPILGNGTSPLIQGTRSGNTTKFGTVLGNLISGNCITSDVNSNIIDEGGPCVSSSSGVSAGTTPNLSYYATSGSVVSDSGIAVGFTGTAAVTSQISQLPIAANNIAGSPMNSGQCLTSGGSAQGGWQTCPSSNLARNSSMVDTRCTGYNSWGGTQCDNVVSTSGGWCTEGIYIIPVGDNVTCRTFAGGGSFPPSGVIMLGGASLTDIKLRFVQESYTSILMKNHTATFQVSFWNNSGAPFTPTFSTKYPTAVDNWSGNTADVPSVALNECAPTAGTGSSCLLNYTFTPAPLTSGGVENGYEELLDLNLTNNASGGIAIIPGFGLNITDGLPNGTGAGPIAEILNPAWDHLWNQRFYQTFTNLNALNINSVFALSVAVSGTTVNFVLPFVTTMRAVPALSVTSTGMLSVNGQSTTNITFSNTTAMSTLVAAVVGTVSNGSVYVVLGQGNTNALIADASITGG